MNLPLATLQRHSTLVHLMRRVASHSGTEDEPEPLRFSGIEDAERYLRFWLSDGAAMSQFRMALHDSGHSGLVGHRSDHEVTSALASKLLSRSLVLVEEGPPIRPLTVAWTVSTAAPLSEPPPVTVEVRAPKKPAVTPPALPLLPLLEEVQIEGAKVLPEVLQTLEQIDLTMGSLDLAGVSLEPAPSGVASISQGMQQASATVTAAIDAL